MDFQGKIEKTRRYAALLASADVIFYTLPWLMVLVVLGTITQKELGLYEATEKYFNSIILWLGPIPTPGGLATIGFIAISLLIKFIFFSKWNRDQAGIIITHLGILLLLLGGLLTASLSREGFMIIPEGRNIDSVSDYHQRVMSITPENGETIFFQFDALEKDQDIEIENLGINIKILERCNNCSAQAPSGKYKNLKGLAQNMELFPIPSEKEKEINFSGAILEVKSAHTPKEDGTYIVMEDIPKNPVFTTDLGETEISLGRAKTRLPFSITLQDFRKIDYPGTVKAREFESDLIIQDGNISWPITIRMNEPLRYKGYTFYQSSFEQRPDIEVTVLSVVKNAGRAFPYISTLVIFLGLLIHFIIRMHNQKEKTS